MAGPEYASRLHVIVKRAHACEIAREHSGVVHAIVKNETPVADQMDQTVRSPTFVDSTHNRLVAGIALQRVSQLEQQIVAIIETAIPVEYFNSQIMSCLLYTSDAADERSSVDLGGRRII